MDGGGRLRILIVDSDEQRRTLFADTTRAEGHEVTTHESLSAGDPSEAVDVLVIGGPQVPELAARYRRDRAAKWILAVVTMEEAHDALVAGADDCLTEPHDRDSFCLRMCVARATGGLAPDFGGEPPAVASLDEVVPKVSARQLRGIFDLLPVPAGVVDNAGRFVQCNRSLERLFHQPPGAVAGRPLAEFFTTADVESILTDLNRHGHVVEHELQLLDRYGEEYWVAGTARWIPTGGGYVIGTFSDITERRLYEEALRQSEASLRSVLQASPDGIIVHANGRYLFLNPAAVEQLGFENSAALLDSSIYDRVHPDEVDEIRGRVQTMMAQGEPAPVRDIQFVRPDGGVFVGEVASIPATFDGMPAIISQIRDVGERRRMQSQRFLADRLATVGTLAVGVAHEINNPLAFVVGNLGLLADELDKQVRMRDDPAHAPSAVAASRARIRELLARTQEGAERVRRIVRDLGRFARPDAGEDEVVDLHALLDSTMEIADVQIRHRAKLTRDFGAHGLVFGSEARIGQVFLNLLVNAGQAIEPGSPRANEVAVVTRDLADGRVEVEVADTGCGIPESQISRIFDPFFTTKAPGEGTGIGLAISHSIVAQLGGELAVESEHDRGTRFFVRLRRADVQHTRRGTGSVGDGTRGSPHKARVLVVDDEPLIREMVCDALSAHDVHAVATGLQALERMTADDWDLILCDVIIPDLTGVELWHALAKSRPEVLGKLVFMTGGDFTGTGPKFPSNAKIRRLEKPFSIKTLRALADAART